MCWVEDGDLLYVEKGIWWVGTVRKMELLQSLSTRSHTSAVM